MSSSRRHTAEVAGLVALVGGSGVLHFLATGSYARIVPRALPAPRLIVQVSGAAELACAALMILPRTRRLGGLLTAALLVAVFPANVQMALDGGIAGAGFPAGSAVLAWLRLPLQMPLVLLALKVARRGRLGFLGSVGPAD